MSGPPPGFDAGGPPSFETVVFVPTPIDEFFYMIIGMGLASTIQFLVSIAFPKLRQARSLFWALMLTTSLIGIAELLALIFFDLEQTWSPLTSFAGRPVMPAKQVSFNFILHTNNIGNTFRLMAQTRRLQVIADVETGRKRQFLRAIVRLSLLLIVLACVVKTVIYAYGCAALNSLPEGELPFPVYAIMDFGFIPQVILYAMSFGSDVTFLYLLFSSQRKLRSITRAPVPSCQSERLQTKSIGDESPSLLQPAEITFLQIIAHLTMEFAVAIINSGYSHIEVLGISLGRISDFVRGIISVNGLWMVHHVNQTIVKARNQHVKNSIKRLANSCKIA